MPKNTRVHKRYTYLRKKGLTKRMAAIVSQKQTGQALKTGKPIQGESK